MAFPTLTGIVYTIKGSFFLYTYELHRKHGPIVRIGPNRISVADPQLARKILRTDDLPKDAMVYKSFRLSEGPSENLLTTLDRDFHRRTRGILSPAFSTKYLENLEPLMIKVWNTLQRRLDESAGAGAGDDGWTTEDVVKLVHNVALDVIGESAFGRSFDMVESGNNPLLTAINRLLVWSALGMTLPILHVIPVQFVPFFGSAQTVQSRIMGAIIRERRDASRGPDGTGRRADILQFLLDKEKKGDGDGSALELDVTTNANLFLLAGSETSANAMAFFWYFALAKRPDYLSALRAELDRAFPEGTTKALDLATLKTVALLDAGIKETLRLAPVVPFVSRETTEDATWRYKDADAGGEKTLQVPKGTRLNVQVYALQRCSELWLRGDEFLPERWIEGHSGMGNEEVWGVTGQGSAGHGGGTKEAQGSLSAEWGRPRLVNRDLFLPFSSGSRDCIGRNFAMNEMRIVLGHLIRRYDIAPGWDTLVDVRVRQFVTMQVTRTGGLPIKVKARKA
ncbi:cytochrome P450 [Gonapodya prolifera JEL478]|uniref:Cytochrome P450 n=1 Tax=Gonapodya prolifera (strain JEL478) TaxID=1344416 RepID=A0A139A577_GONPJ|nr:cytochrome P450 [Gonapodya prolifera JEL478]|eukprot:KXS11967.1 cytochrome P450 [Gonapodya prolifera JEL478]